MVWFLGAFPPFLSFDAIGVYAFPSSSKVDTTSLKVCGCIIARAIFFTPFCTESNLVGLKVGPQNPPSQPLLLDLFFGGIAYRWVYSPSPDQNETLFDEKLGP